MTSRFAVSLALLCAAISLVGCETYDRARVGARVSPFIVRNDPRPLEAPSQQTEATDESKCPDVGDGTHTDGSLGSGGYLVPCNRQNRLNVKELRRTEPMPVNLDTLKLTHDSEYAADLAKRSRTDRNRLLSYLLTRSEEVCIGHKSDILAVGSAANAGLSATTSLISGIGAAVTGETTTRALAAAAGFINAQQDNFNQNIFYSNVADAIVRQIDTQRTAVLEKIIPKKLLAPEDYTVEDIEHDVNQYHFACSFSEAVAALADHTKRPSTADELRGRIAGNLLLIEANRKAMNGATKKEKGSLEQTNESLAKANFFLTQQLSFIQGTASSTGETASGATAGTDDGGDRKKQEAQ